MGRALSVIKLPLTMCLAHAVLSHRGSGRGMSRGVGTTTSIDWPSDSDSGSDTRGAAFDTELLLGGWWSAAATTLGRASAAVGVLLLVLEALLGVAALADVPRIWAFLQNKTGNALARHASAAELANQISTGGAQGDADKKKSNVNGRAYIPENRLDIVCVCVWLHSSRFAVVNSQCELVITYGGEVNDKGKRHRPPEHSSALEWPRPSACIR